MSDTPRRKVYIPDPKEAPARTARIFPEGRKQKKWWQTCGVEEFLQRLEDMSFEETASLKDELDGAIVITHGAMENTEFEWGHRQRARQALRFMVEKRKLMKSVLRRKYNKQKGIGGSRKTVIRNEYISKTRELARAGKFEEAIEKMLDIMQGNIYDDLNEE